MSDLSTQTPVEIDTALADVYARYYIVTDKRDLHTKWIEDMEEGLAKHLSGEHGYRYSSYTQERLNDLLAKRDVLVQEAYEILAESVPFEREFSTRPWTRFFLVKNNGGHIHSSMDCSTCYPTTRFGWLPTLSGQTEEQAVAEQGAILCTVCFPSAPTEWTNGKKVGECEGSGRLYDTEEPKRTGFYSGNWGHCVVCGSVQTVTKNLLIRKHKTPQS